MLHPVGSRSASTYWRRRLLVVAVVVLLVLSVYVLFFGGSDSSTTSATGSPSPFPTAGATSIAGTDSPAASTDAATTPAGTSAVSTSAAGPATSSSAATPSPAATPTVAGAVSACEQGSLSITAGSSAPTYALTAQPVLFLQVTDTGPVPCSLDLADAQIELIVYNGASRVWGSHDCAVLPGTSVQTLAVNTPVARSITWSGLASAPGACQNRQHVAAGTYTLHAKLAGVEGATSTFTLT